MASRLAVNLSRGLRSRSALSLPFKRGLATPISNTVGKTQTTTLKNGLTVRHPRPARANWPRPPPSLLTATLSDRYRVLALGPDLDRRRVD